MFHDVNVSILEKKDAPKNDSEPFAFVGCGYSIGIHTGLQKSMDDTMKDAEEAFDKIEKDPKLKKQVQDAVNKEIKKALGK